MGQITASPLKSADSHQDLRRATYQSVQLQALRDGFTNEALALADPRFQLQGDAARVVGWNCLHGTTDAWPRGGRDG